MDILKNTSDKINRAIYISDIKEINENIVFNNDFELFKSIDFEALKQVLKNLSVKNKCFEIHLFIKKYLKRKYNINSYLTLGNLKDESAWFYEKYKFEQGVGINNDKNIGHAWLTLENGIIIDATYSSNETYTNNINIIKTFYYYKDVSYRAIEIDNDENKLIKENFNEDIAKFYINMVENHIKLFT